MNKLGTFVISVSWSPSLSLAPSLLESSVLSESLFYFLPNLSAPYTSQFFLSVSLALYLPEWAAQTGRTAKAAWSTNWRRLERPWLSCSGSVSWGEKRDRGRGKKKEIEWWESVGVEKIKRRCIKTAENTHTHKHTSTHIQFHSECTTKSGLCTQPASEIRHGVHSPFKAAGRRSYILLAALTQHKVASAGWCAMRRFLVCVTSTLAHQAACFSAQFSRQQTPALLQQRI